jgi:hypothetical protein
MVSLFVPPPFVFRDGGFEGGDRCFRHHLNRVA